jgi:hypothetical protein
VPWPNDSRALRKGPPKELLIRGGDPKRSSDYGEPCYCAAAFVFCWPWLMRASGGWERIAKQTYHNQPDTRMGSNGTMNGSHKFDCWTTPVWLHLANASGPDHLSTAVPPTAEYTRPTGTLPPSE